MKHWISIGILLIVGLASVMAQPTTVTDDDVVDIAEHMYCPVCENEPLDECRNQTCIQWKQEIRRQLEAGQNQDQIITYFVDRYGQMVVGVPTDPFLRALALGIPVIGGALALLIGWWTFQRWQQADLKTAPATPDASASTLPDDDYRQRLEQDLL